MDIDEILDRDHPSFNTGSAAFLFTIGTKLLVVEARNRFAVVTLERLLIQNCQSVSKTCRVLSIFRNCNEAGIRDESVEEVPYVEFMTEIVDPSRLLVDQITLTSFSQSLTPEERAHVVARERALEATTSSDASVPSPEEAANPDTRRQLIAALSGLGFKKGDVEKFVRGLGSRADREPITDLLREGLRSINS